MEIPKDRGWAWLIALASFGSHFVLSSVLKTFGLLMAEFQDKYDCSTWAINTVNGTMLFLWLAIAPVSAALARRFTIRQVVFVAGLLGAVGSVGGCFSSTYLWFFVFQGVFVGTSIGLFYTPLIVVIVVYFEKRRGLATSISQSGAGAAAITMPFVVRYLVDSYGLSGELVIQGGILAQMCVFAMLIRPTTFYTHRLSEYQDETIDEESKMNTNDDMNDNKHPDQSMEIEKDVDSMLVTNCGSVRKHSKSTSNIAYAFELFSRAENSQDDAVYSNVQVVDQLVRTVPRDLHPKRVLSDSCPDNFILSDIQYNDKNQDETVEELKERKCTKYFDWTMFKNPLFIFYFIGAVGSDISWVTGFYLFPYLGRDLHLHPNHITWLISMHGIADIISRIFIGPFSDLNLVPRKYIFSSFVIIQGLVALLAPFINNYVGLSVCTICYGICGGVTIPLAVLVISDVIPVNQCPSACAALFFVEAISANVVAQITGRMYDITGSVHASFWLTSSLTLISGVICCSEPLLSKYRLSKQAKHPEEKEDC